MLCFASKTSNPGDLNQPHRDLFLPATVVSGIRGPPGKPGPRGLNTSSRLLRRRHPFSSHISGCCKKDSTLYRIASLFFLIEIRSNLLHKKFLPPGGLRAPARGRSFGNGRCFFGSKVLKTIIYIDGFNLYYGALKRTAYRWLDLDLLGQALLKPENQICRIRYFTAKIDPRPHDLDQPIRQLAYLRALSTIPHLDIHEGTFQTRPSTLPTRQSVEAGHPQFVEVMRAEEKGSDVNLASYLLLDAFKGEFDCAIVISNDSDLLTPIRMVRFELGLLVGGFLPRSKGSAELKDSLNFWKPIRPNVLERCQFPAVMRDERGEFHKPKGW